MGGVTQVVGAAGVIAVAPTRDAKVSVLSGGPRGEDGVAVSHVHAQPSASAEWIVNHNLGARPIVTVLSPGGVEVEANVVHVNTNQLRVYFASAQTGSVRCI